MCALGKAVFAYTNDARDHFTRTTEFFDGRFTRDPSGAPRGPAGMSIEDFDMIDNLMMHGGVESRGGAVVVGNAPQERLLADLKAFERVLKVAAAAILKRQ